MKKYLIVDLANSFFRAMHVTHRASSLEEKVAFSLHLTLQGISAAWREQKATHLVCVEEGRSWRKEFYPSYKANRAVKRSSATVKEQEELKASLAALDDMATFLRERTNVTVIQHPKLEADDLIAGWIQFHPQDEHVIYSSDSDFYQLLANNVTQYNGVSQELHTLNGIYDQKGNLVKDKKTLLPKTIPDPEYLLFEKIVRGDTSDNIFSAYPGARTKGSKNKTGIKEAFDDRKSKGFNFNNFMLQRWVDHNNVEHKVYDDFQRNKILIDLTAQPVEIRAIIEETVKGVTSKSNPMIGVYFLKFCGKYALLKISENANTYNGIFSSSY
jgi:5'-3' exonuclease